MSSSLGRLSLALLALAACSGDAAPTEPAIPPDRAFPAGFLWSVATLAQESEGDNVHSDWDAFATLGKAPPAGKAQSSYELYDVDNRNAASLHLNSFQLTIEWARLIPKMPTDPAAPLDPKDVDPKEVAHYHAVLKSMHDAGLTPVVTVTHFSYPTWIATAAFDDKTNSFTDGSLGGWTNPATGRRWRATPRSSPRSSPRSTGGSPWTSRWWRWSPATWPVCFHRASRSSISARRPCRTVPLH